MDETLRKSIKNGLWVALALASFSFFYGGIYTQMILGDVESSISNILMSFLGAVLLSLLYGFLPIFVISLIWFYFKNK